MGVSTIVACSSMMKAVAICLFKDLKPSGFLRIIDLELLSMIL